MFKNYLKTALRNIMQNKGYSFINLVGLTLGITCCILILLWVRDERGFDRFHKNSDRIYRVVTRVKSADRENHYASTPPPLGPYLKNQYPEVINFTRFRMVGEWLIKHNQKVFIENGVALADPSFFEIFSFPFAQGNLETALSDPQSLVITEAMAGKYFGQENPIGKSLFIQNQFDFKVTGVIKNIPRNSHLRFDFIVPFKLIGEQKLEHWGDNDYYTYILVREGISSENLDQKISDAVRKNRPGSTTDLYLQPLTDIYLHSHFDVDIYGPSKPKKDIYIFSLIAFFVLFIACMNFMNLATARSSKRAKEIALRKVAGARKKSIIGQFFGESLLFAFAAFLLSIFLMDFFLPVFRNFSGKNLSLDLFGNISFLLALIGIAAVTGLISGCYPALFLSSFQSVEVLKGPINPAARSSWFRRILVVVQFSISIFLIIGTIAIYKQLDYMKNIDPGYNKKNLIYIKARGDMNNKYETLKEELLKNPAISAVTISSDLPTEARHLWGGLDWPGKDPKDKREMYFFTVDPDFIKTFEIEIVEGRDFSDQFATDSSNFIINETAEKFMGLDKPVGKWLNVRGSKGTIVGVMKDFNFAHLRSKVGPLVLRVSKNLRNFIFLKVKPGNVLPTTSYIESTWKKFNPAFPIEYHFLDDALEKLYLTENRLGRLFNFFAFVAIFISCLGLVGLASFMVDQRTKEIGIRKALGASVQGIFLLLSKEFGKWVLLANIIALPAAYYAVNQWLQNFAYRTTVGVFIYIASALLALVIALLTVSYQSIMVALTNPVTALKCE